MNVLEKNRQKCSQNIIGNIYDRNLSKYIDTGICIITKDRIYFSQIWRYVKKYYKGLYTFVNNNGIYTIQKRG